MKLCTKCKQNKPESQFHRRRKDSGVLRNFCQECCKADMRKWRRTPKGRASHQKHNMLPKNRELRKQYEKTEKCRTYRSEYRSSKRGQALRRERVRRYAATAKGRAARANGNACRTAKVCAGNGNLSAGEWRAILAQANGYCHYCKCAFDRLTMDHVVSLARGGPHTKTNVAAACAQCNSRKGTMSAERFRSQVA